MIDVDVLSIIQEYFEKVVAYMPRILLALIIFLAGMTIIKRLLVFLDKAINNSRLSDNIKPFLKSFLSILLKGVLIIVLLAVVGVKTAGLMTLIAALGFGVAIALQGSLGNLAAGILIMIFRPYKIGDLIKIGDARGYVKEIQLLNTVITGLDNRDVIIPNGTAISENLTNSSNNEIVRLEFEVYMPYDESFPRVKEIIHNTLLNSEYILESPEPLIGIESFDTHSIILTIRPYCKFEHEEQAYFDATLRVKEAMGASGIKVAYSEGIEMGTIAQ